MKKVKDRAKWLPWGRAFQVEGTTSTRPADAAWLVGGQLRTAGRLLWLERSDCGDIEGGEAGEEGVRSCRACEAGEKT